MLRGSVYKTSHCHVLRALRMDVVKLMLSLSLRFVQATLLERLEDAIP